jgi:hypothetical protein
MKMMEKAESKLRALNRRLGYADPASCKYLFIGIEEGGGPYDLDDFSADTKPIEPWTGRVAKVRGQWSTIYGTMSKIVAALECTSDLETYQTTRMCHAGDVTGLMNLFPLPKKSLDAWPYKALTKEQYREWLFYHLHERYAAIREERSRMPKLTATICFGTTSWQDFIHCLNLSGDEYAEDAGVRVYPTRKVVLTPFFQQRYGTFNDARDVPKVANAVRSFSAERTDTP